MTSHHFNIETIGIVGSGAMGPGYPPGPRTILAVLHHIRAVPDDPRERPSPRLAHRAQPGLPLTQPDATDINEPNEARA